MIAVIAVIAVIGLVEGKPKEGSGAVVRPMIAVIAVIGLVEGASQKKEVEQ